MLVRRDELERIRGAVRKVEGLPPEGMYYTQPTEPRFGYLELDERVNRAPFHSFVRIAGERIAPGYYPAVVCALDRETGEWSDLIGSIEDGIEVWVRTPGLLTLEVDGHYWGRAEGPLTVGSEQRGLYLVDDPCCDGGTWECEPVATNSVTFTPSGVANGSCSDCANLNTTATLEHTEGGFRYTGTATFIACAETCRWKMTVTNEGSPSLETWTLAVRRESDNALMGISYSRQIDWDETGTLTLFADSGFACSLGSEITITHS